MKACFTLLAAFLALLLAPSARAQSSPAPDDLSKYKTADDLWAHVQELAAGPAAPPSSPVEAAALLNRIIGASAEFQTRYPKDPRRWDARMLSLQFDSILDQVESRQPDAAKIESELKAVFGAPDAPEGAKRQARLSLIGLHAGASGQEPLTPEVDKEMLAFIHDFPDEPADVQLQSMRLDSLQKTDPAKVADLLASLLKDPNPAVVEMAQAKVRIRDLRKKPLEMQFTALDGSKVDVSKLRGKVVLIDFWATWCPPCMEKAPEVVAAYNELHGKGLEIVGISLDQDKSLVQAVTQTKGMVWPEYFDGKGGDNEISSGYGITTIPRMWLVDKKGMVVDTDAGAGFKEKIEKLLAE